MMFSQKFYRYFRYLSLLAGLLFFTCLQLLDYAGTPQRSNLRNASNYWEAHWHFFVHKDNLYVLIFCFVECFLPLRLTVLVDKFVYPRFKKSQ